jgi:branched-chain amino acid transport system permease protein
MEILIIGLVRGSLYSLISVGFVLVFSVGGILNLCHGILYMMGAYFTYIFYAYFFNSGGKGILISSMILAIFSVVILALSIYLFIYKRHIKRGQTLEMSINALMVLGLVINGLISEVMALLFGSTAATVPALIDGSADFLGVRCINQELLLMPVTLIVLLCLWFFLKHTRPGIAVSAVAQNKYGALLMGVSAEMSLMITIGLSAFLAAVAGTLVSSVHAVVPYMWVFPLIKSFCIAIVGGFGSIPGAVAASFLVSFAEVAGALAISEHVADFISLILLAVILLARPEGLMGVKNE